MGLKLRNKKTGEIGEILGTDRAAGIINICINFHDGNPRAYNYKSLAELNEVWEDYKPTEPLIKDEKIRKAVRAWAEVNSIGNARYTEIPDRILCVLTDTDDNDYDIHFVGHIPTLEDGDDYTITELCGEEEG